MKQLATQHTAADETSRNLLELARQFREFAELLATPRRAIDHRCLRVLHDVETLLEKPPGDGPAAAGTGGPDTHLRQLLDAIGPALVLDVSASQALPEPRGNLGDREYDVVLLRESDTARTAYHQISTALDLLRWGGIVVLADYVMPTAAQRGNGQFLAAQRATRENPNVAIVPYPPGATAGSQTPGIAVLARIPG